ncbi:hypothetical protein ARTHRO8AJ_90032 [Arthrobacter sp. 8AJ]|nr:hypothetical protein ARTHRO8AJ_90032 [Arthrobacter sp. 8AJ]
MCQSQKQNIKFSVVIHCNSVPQRRSHSSQHATAPVLGKRRQCKLAIVVEAAKVIPGDMTCADTSTALSDQTRVLVARRSRRAQVSRSSLRAWLRVQRRPLLLMSDTHSSVSRRSLKIATARQV